MKLTILTLLGTEYLVDIDANASITELRELINEQSGMVPKQQRLIFPVPQDILSLINRIKPLADYDLGHISEEELHRKIGGSAGVEALRADEKKLNQLAYDAAAKTSLNPKHKLTEAQIPDGARILLILKID